MLATDNKIAVGKLLLRKKCPYYQEVGRQIVNTVECRVRHLRRKEDLEN
jgi:hypothetical protein